MSERGEFLTRIKTMKRKEKEEEVLSNVARERSLLTSCREIHTLRDADEEDAGVHLSGAYPRVHHLALQHHCQFRIKHFSRNFLKYQIFLQISFYCLFGMF